ncbi:MAG: hypothetical protein V5A33_07575, partial [Halobacteriales archaeon]
MTDVEEIYAAVEDLEGEMLSFFREFLAIPTENPPGRNYPEGADFLASKLREFGYRPEKVEVSEAVVEEHYPGRSNLPRVNVLGRKDGDADGPDVHFTGHFDVVPAGEDWTKDPYDPVVE